MRKRNQSQLNDYWLSHCGWCRRKLGEDEPRIAISTKFRDPEEYFRKKGKIIQFALTGRIVIAAVVKPDSPARKEGKEVIVMVCSDHCGNELVSAIREESALESGA